MAFCSQHPILVFFFLAHLSSILQVLTMNEDGQALLSFKSSITQDPFASLSNWNSSDPNPCSWNGVTCNNGRVVSLSLPKKRLSGSIPSSISSLTTLRHINLRNNQLVGLLPSGLFTALGLQSLVLYGNRLSGPLPREMGELHFIQNLDLSQNFFNDSIPNSLVQCKRLRTLDLSHNNFSNPLPPRFGIGFAALENLDLSYNEFNGSIPRDIGNLTNLQGTVDFSHNLFSGSIPPSLGNLPEKVYIDLAFNNLTGPIPQNGALVNRGPTAFVGNPGLCGPPLKNPCAFLPPVAGPPPFPAVKANSTSIIKLRNKMSKGVVAAIVLGDITGVALIALIFFYLYRIAVSIKLRDKAVEDDDNGDEKNISKECFCFRSKNEFDSPDRSEQPDLVPLDKQLHFDLDELLKASAFILGKSKVGIVYRVVLDNGLNLAVRRLGGGSQKLKEFRAEVEAIGMVRHTNIVTLRAYYWSAEEKLLVYDYIPNGNLSTTIHGQYGWKSSSPLPWAVRLTIMKGIAEGLCFLHEFSPKKYVHGDLNPNNILLGPNMEPYISDFGLAHLANIASGSPQAPENARAASTIGPSVKPKSCYQAPETLKSLKPSQKWDVYSLGVMFLELVSWSPSDVLQDRVDMDLSQWAQFLIEEKKPLDELLGTNWFAHRPEEEEEEEDMISVLRVALDCVQYDPGRRPSMRHVVELLEEF